MCRLVTTRSRLGGIRKRVTTMSKEAAVSAAAFAVKEGAKASGVNKTQLAASALPGLAGVGAFLFNQDSRAEEALSHAEGIQAILRQGSKDDVRRAQEMLSGGHGELSGRLDTHAGELSGAASQAGCCSREPPKSRQPGDWSS